MSVSSFSSAAKPGVCLSTDRPDSPFDGQVIYETDTNRTLVYDNSAWVVIHDPTLMSYSGTGVTVTADAASIGGENVTPYTGRKNAIINGDMRIAQRGTSVSHASGGGGSYFHCDRWRGSDYNWSGNTITRSQSTDAPDGFTHSLKWENDSNTLTFGSGGSMYIEQRMEGYNVSHLYDSTYATLSFWVKSSTAGTYTCHFSNGAFARILQKEFSITSANTWEHKSIVVPMSSGTSSGTWPIDNTLGMRVQWYIGAHADRTGDDYLNSWGNISNYHYLTTNSVNLATIANSSFYLSGVQLELGDKATPFEHRSYGEELALCQRYYQRHVIGGAYFPIAAAMGSTNGLIQYSFPVTMRATPTLTASSGALFRPLSTGGSVIGTTDTTSVAWYSTATPYGGQIYFSGSSGLTAGTAIGVYVNTYGGGWLEFNGAEL